MIVCHGDGLPRDGNFRLLRIRIGVRPMAQNCSGFESDESDESVDDMDEPQWRRITLGRRYEL